MRIFKSIPALILGLAFALPVTGLSKDKHHDDHHDRHDDHHDSHYHGYNHSYGSPYRSSGYRNYGYSSYRDYDYDYGYRPYYYSRPSIGVEFSSGPTYYSSPTYRGRVASSYSDSLAADVQRSLRSRGYYHGSIDGDAGPGTRSAIRSYQARHGLNVTGRIDSSLLRSLGIR